MALPGPKDLLPDHLFYNASSRRPPPAPSSILAPAHPYNPSFVSPVYARAQNLPVSHSSLTKSYVLSPPASHPPKSGLEALQAGTERSAGVGADSTFAQVSDIQSESARSEEQGDRSRYDKMQHREDSRGLPLDHDENETGKKHACSACGKCFNRPSSLRIHLNTHTGAKPYVCPFPGCSRSFNVSSNMRRHYRNHSNRIPPPLAIPIHAYAPPLHWSISNPHAKATQAKRMPYKQRALLVETPQSQLVGCGRVLYQENDKRWTATGQHAYTPTLAQGPQDPPYHTHPYQPASSPSHFSRGPYPPSPPYLQQNSSYPYPPPQSNIAYARPGHTRTDVGQSGSSNEYHAQLPSVHPIQVHSRQFAAPTDTLHQVSTVHPVRMNDDTQHQTAQYGVPPTPPYTNEAAQSPSALSSARSEGRQQSSPNASGLHSGRRNEPPLPIICARTAESPPERSTETRSCPILIKEVEHLTHEDTPVSSRRSNLRITAIMNPVDNPQVQAATRKYSRISTGDGLPSRVSD